MDSSLTTSLPALTTSLPALNYLSVPSLSMVWLVLHVLVLDTCLVWCKELWEEIVLSWVLCEVVFSMEICPWFCFSRPCSFWEVFVDPDVKLNTQVSKLTQEAYLSGRCTCSCRSRATCRCSLCLWMVESIRRLLNSEVELSYSIFLVTIQSGERSRPIVLVALKNL